MVSIHIVPVIVCLIIKVISSTFRFKRVIEVEGFHLNYTLFPSNKIYKENKKYK